MIASHDGISLSFDVEGAGEPLLMIMGLSGSKAAWWRLLPHVTPHAEAITFDNRGTGDSDRTSFPPTPLSMADMVVDALAVLDAAGHESAHVMGVSLGGMVAQHLALDHRERVRSLILGCTTPGGRRGEPPWRLLAATALRPFVGSDRTLGIVAPALYSERTRDEHPDRVHEDLRKRLEEATDVRTTLAQMAAVARHDTRDRLPELAGLPTTVIHGDEDALVPYEAGREIADAIPGARLVTLAGAGHMLTTDAEAESAAAVLGHLDACTAPARAA